LVRPLTFQLLGSQVQLLGSEVLPNDQVFGSEVRPQKAAQNREASDRPPKGRLNL
jgi:hypothetical protein